MKLSFKYFHLNLLDTEDSVSQKLVTLLLSRLIIIIYDYCDVRVKQT